MAGDITETLQQQVQRAAAEGTALDIQGGGSKRFLGHAARGSALRLRDHHGIIDYDPSELVLTARAGTPLTEIENALAASAQMLPFEPPHFGPGATLGGTIACGLSGPRRPYAGSARDFVLGCKMLNGAGELLNFGGRVMKNVAGYDVPRLMTGAHGTLGLLLEISLKVLPRPPATLTLIQECSADAAIARMSHLLSQPVPVDGACYHAGHCYLRVSGSTLAVKHAHEIVGGEVVERPEHFWQQLREHQLPFFSTVNCIYRVLVKPATPPLPLAGNWLLDWGGAQRWLVSEEPLARIRACVSAAGGHVTQFRGAPDGAEIFQPLSAPMLALHQRLKASFDPHCILNPGRIYANL
jgi:glycolate oxidase FAD binding subunit